MTSAHLMFAVMTTIYILMAIQWEEKDLVAIHGQAYADYQQRVPMLIPGLSKGNPMNERPAETRLPA
jgi:methanethiol S-methyltransferase